MSGNKELGVLSPVDIREFWKSEARGFTPWLAKEENISLLGDELGIQLEVVGSEINAGPYSVDILAKDEFDANVIIENQLEQANHDHLGKCLTYAKCHNAKVIIWIAREFSKEHLDVISLPTLFMHFASGKMQASPLTAKNSSPTHLCTLYTSSSAFEAFPYKRLIPKRSPINISFQY